MSAVGRSAEVCAAVEDGRVLELEQAVLRIPSPVFEEHDLADYLAERMTGMGLDVRMMDVTHPGRPGQKTRQPIGLLRGTGGGPTLMLNGHMDPAFMMSGWTVDPHGGHFADGWVWGAGAHDDKGGVVAALSALDAIQRAGTRLKGDVLMCCVAAHKAGGVGTRVLLQEGVRADACINMEHSANTIATTITGSVRIGLTTRSTGLFFRYTPEAKAAYWNAIEQQGEIMRRLGPSLDPADPATSWMDFAPHPDLPGFPLHRFDRIGKEHYLRDCKMVMQVRTVPGQTAAGIAAETQRVLDGIKADFPAFDCEMTVPEGGADDPFIAEPSEIAKNHPLVVALAEGQRRASGREPEVGGVLRVGNYGDGNILAAAGIPSLQYGPGDVRIYPEWPAPDERVELRELVEASRAIAHAVLAYCG
ncbi:MAG: M20/M25/M40 family metallo-hydrolase [Acetobacterales bacterium]